MVAEKDNSDVSLFTDLITVAFSSGGNDSCSDGGGNCFDVGSDGHSNVRSGCGGYWFPVYKCALTNQIGVGTQMTF